MSGAVPLIEVVQRREGLWLYRAGVGSRCVRPLHGDPGRGLPQPRRGRYGRIRGRPGSEGLAGAERPQGLIDAVRSRNGSGAPLRACLRFRALYWAMIPLRGAVLIRDPPDGARFYLSAHFIESDADMVAMYDSAGFGNARGVALVDRTKRDLTRVFGRPHVLGAGAWQWRYGRRVVRLSWRGRGTARWVSITLTDGAVMDRISRYAKAAARRKP